MLRLIATPFLNIGRKLLDDAIPPEDLRQFLITRLDNDFRPSALADPNMQDDFIAAAELCFKMNMYAHPIATDTPTTPAPTISQIEAWINDLPNERIVSSKYWIPESDKYLLAAQDHRQLSTFVASNMEKLLLHVEVKRKDCLPHTPQAARHGLSIALSRYARRKNDLRFLNTALKLNDWAYKQHRRQRPNPASIRYLLALAEAEYALQELQP